MSSLACHKRSLDRRCKSHLYPALPEDEPKLGQRKRKTWGYIYRGGTSTNLVASRLWHSPGSFGFECKKSSDQPRFKLAEGDYDADTVDLQWKAHHHLAY